MAEIKIFTELAELESIKGAWDALARRTADPNVFYESIMLLPAWKYLKKPKDLFLFTMWEDSQLIALFPFCQNKRFNRLPFKHLSNWQYLHCYLATPLVREGFEVQFAKEFTDWFKNSKFSARTFRWIQVNSDSAIYRAIEESAVSEAVSKSYEIFQRAYFQKLASYEDHIDQMISGKHKRDFKRKRRRLEEAGKLTFHKMEHETNLAVWLEEFLGVEGSGWKGREGTALKCSDSDRSFVREVCQRAIDANALVTCALRLDGRMIAASIDFKRGSGLFYFKIGFDERYSRQSPGVLLELDHLRVIYDYPEIEWADSCTAPDNEILNRFWFQKRNISTLSVAYRNFPDRSFLELVLPAVTTVSKKIKVSASKESKA